MKEAWTLEVILAINLEVDMHNVGFSSIMRNSFAFLSTFYLENNFHSFKNLFCFATTLHAIMVGLHSAWSLSVGVALRLGL